MADDAAATAGMEGVAPAAAAAAPEASPTDTPAPAPAPAPATGSDETAPMPAAAAAGVGETLGLRIVYAKKTHKISVALDSTLAQLKDQIEGLTQCPAPQQKLMFKGLLAGPDKPGLDAMQIKDTKLTKNAKVLVVGATASAILSMSETESQIKLGGAAAMDSRPERKVEEKWCQQTIHKKVLDKGKPSDATFAYRPGNDPLPEGPLCGLYNKSGGKLRLNFKLNGELVIGTKERTQKIRISQIAKVSSQPIVGHEEYHILCLQFGPTEKSNYFVYWFPQQYLAAVKGAVTMHSFS